MPGKSADEELARLRLESGLVPEEAVTGTVRKTG
jgi:hypothetical protein